jgi:hypothetical protein
MHTAAVALKEYEPSARPVAGNVPLNGTALLVSIVQTPEGDAAVTV